MARNYLGDYNQLAVAWQNAETALNTEQTLDTLLLVAKGDIASLDRRREANVEELTGKEEPDTVYDMGALSSMTLNFNMAQAQHFAGALAFALGVDTPAAWGDGYKHAITEAAGLILPSFTAAQRLGQTIFKRLFASMFIDQLTATFAKDSWAKLVLGCKGTGKYTDNMYKETVTAAYNAESLTLAANAVEGATAAARLDSVHHIRVKVPATGEWVDVVFSAVSDAEPAVITIAAPGGAATETQFEILYVPEESGWMTFPARVEEPPLRVTDLVLSIGGKWNGSAFLGGHTLSEEIESFEWVLNNNLAIEFRVGGTGSYANYAQRRPRTQTIRLNRELRDFILEQRMKDNEYIGVYCKATGAEFETGKNYYIELVWPRCNVLTAAKSLNGRVLQEAGDLVVLKDDTYASVLATVANEVAAYAA